MGDQRKSPDTGGASRPGSTGQQQNSANDNSAFRPGVQDHSAYAEWALSGIIDGFYAESQTSGRNVALNTAAFRAGQLVGGNVLGRGTAEQALVEAARSVGVPDHESASTIKSGLNSGMREPRRPEELQSGGGHQQARRQTPPPGRQPSPDQADKARRAALIAQQVCRMRG